MRRSISPGGESQTWTVYGYDGIDVLRFYAVDNVVTASGDVMAILENGDVFLLKPQQR